MFFHQYAIERSPRVTLIDPAIGGSYLSLTPCVKEDDIARVRTRRIVRFVAIITVFDVAAAGGGRSIGPADSASFLSPPLLLLS